MSVLVFMIYLSNFVITQVTQFLIDMFLKAIMYLPFVFLLVLSLKMMPKILNYLQIEAMVFFFYFSLVHNSMLFCSF